ncbi:hypothetical protein [Caldivirga maquilingensis]|uniref:Uncharacterized protein n=1 Tax=Caldivirga maquilingensis (strain ATCC 700844 / DSM 13496 / JCM 10307 / IC-167) TaxID=397948 RepID=A8MBC7_CALMQ|nr:hypothetical protein [Caldivirga maquilingensis]ABW01217.1 conserved hypothetical protein [Caldivirga maquilingensis IC-167]
MSSSETGSSGSEEEKKQVTIKGVDKELYDKALQMSREMGITVGELINKSLKAFISLADVTNKAVTSMAQAISESSKAFVEGAKGARIISNIDELIVTREDLENLDSQVTFRGIKRLVFSNDVTWELFDSKVSSIVMCDEVVLPKTIPKLKAVEKMRFVKKITVTQ